MRSRARAASLQFLLAAVVVFHAAAQEAPKSQGSAVLAGRVTIGGKPAPGVSVALYRMDSPSFARAASLRTTTDEEGNYKLTGCPAGRYNLLVIAPAYVGQQEGSFGGTSKTVSITEGETVEKLDFKLLRGGVITGRVRQEDGSPAVSERIQLNPVGGQNNWRGFFAENPFMYETDDRGVYRLYGLAPGKYTVSVGEATGEGSIRFGFGGRGYYPRTFHPDTTDPAKAIVIEIGEGTEVTNADITVGRKSRSFVATGRVVDESGKPVAGMQMGHGALVNEGKDMGGMGWGSLSDSEGRFRLDGLLPGRYAAFVWTEGNVEGYSDAVKFEVTDGNVSGLEVTYRRGASVSGVVVIEGTSDPAVLAMVSQLSVSVGFEARGLEVPNYGMFKVAPDGTFRATGLRPGKAGLYVANYPPLPNLALGRIERDGVPQRNIEITPGANITGVRLVLEYGSGRIRGQVTIVNGPLPEGARLGASVRRRGDALGMGYQGHGVEVDSRGHFLFEGLPPGDYDLDVRPYFHSATPHRLPTVTQTVTAVNGVTADITLIMDLNAKPAGGQP